MTRPAANRFGERGQRPPTVSRRGRHALLEGALRKRRYVLEAPGMARQVRRRQVRIGHARLLCRFGFCSTEKADGFLFMGRSPSSSSFALLEEEATSASSNSHACCPPLATVKKNRMVSAIAALARFPKIPARRRVARRRKFELGALLLVDLEHGMTHVASCTDEK